MDLTSSLTDWTKALTAMVAARRPGVSLEPHVAGTWGVDDNVLLVGHDGRGEELACIVQTFERRLQPLVELDTP